MKKSQSMTAGNGGSNRGPFTGLSAPAVLDPPLTAGMLDAWFVF
jgi:hypothetical protein